MSDVAQADAAARRTWRQDPEGRRGRVLDEAAIEFGRLGYGAARLAAIARRADVAEGTVYHLFGSKQGLVVAVGERFGAGLAAAAFADLPADFHPRDVGLVVGNIFAFVRRSRETLGAFLLAAESVEGGEAQAASRDQMVRAVETALRSYRDGGLIPESEPPLNPRVAADLQFAMIEGALKACFLHGDGSQEQLYQQEATRSLKAMLGFLE